MDISHTPFPDTLSSGLFSRLPQEDAAVGLALPGIPFQLNTEPASVRQLAPPDAQSAAASSGNAAPIITPTAFAPPAPAAPAPVNPVAAMLEAMKAESAANEAAQATLQSQVDTERAATTAKTDVQASRASALL